MSHRVPGDFHALRVSCAGVITVDFIVKQLEEQDLNDNGLSYVNSI